jgi:hypothetical protein
VRGARRKKKSASQGPIHQGPSVVLIITRLIRLPTRRKLSGLRPTCQLRWFSPGETKRAHASDLTRQRSAP